MLSAVSVCPSMLLPIAHLRSAVTHARSTTVDRKWMPRPRPARCESQSVSAARPTSTPSIISHPGRAAGRLQNSSVDEAMRCGELAAAMRYRGDVSKIVQNRRFISDSMYSVSQKNPPEVIWFFHFFQKRLRIFNRLFTHLLHVSMYARLQILIQLSPTFTKLCHIKRDYLVHIICAKCPKRVQTFA